MYSAKTHVFSLALFASIAIACPPKHGFCFNNLQSDEASPAHDTAKLTAIVIEAFDTVHEGWSSDEVLLADGRRQNFVTECNRIAKAQELATQPADIWCLSLLKARKRGGLLARATRRAGPLDKSLPDNLFVEQIRSAAEIAARRLFDETGKDTDTILVDEASRLRFDKLASKLAPKAESYLLRKSALQLRKAGKLEPELLTRVTDWKRDFLDSSAQELASNPDSIPNSPGVYIFYDATGYLYIGQAVNLRTRLKNHLRGSDRAALSQYLDKSDTSKVLVELHVFTKDSPGKNERIRRAYESELIRTRAPRLNIAK
ncbi:MAG: nucleotide excision repair endonuclease [Planctomycetota bacterium]